MSAWHRADQPPRRRRHHSQPGPIDIALLVGAGERYDAAATAWSYGLLGKRFRDPEGGWCATMLLAGLTWIPGASRAPRGLHLPGTDRWLALARAVGGATRWAAGRGQSHATAVHHLHTVLSFADVPAGRGIGLATLADPVR